MARPHAAAALAVAILFVMAPPAPADPAEPPAASGGEDDDAGDPAPRLSWGAELEFELSDPGRDAEEPDPHFQIDQLYLYPELTLASDTMLHAEIAVKGDGTIIEEAWMRWSSGDRLWVKAGLEDPVIAQVDRKSEAEILLETAFYRSDEMGVQVGGALGSQFDWWASATNGTALGVKQPSEDPAFPILHDARRLDGAGALTYGAGVRVHGTLGDGSAWLMPFAYRGRVNDPAPELGIAASDTQERRGATFGWERGRLTLLAQVLDARDGAFDRSGAFVQPTWRLGPRFELTYRYNRLRVDVPALVADPRTWDRTQHVLALVTRFLDGVLLKTEYYVNREESGGASVDNDELLLQLELSWP